MVHDGVLYVPQAFIALLSMERVQTPMPPAYLADRWVYMVSRPDAPKLKDVPTIRVDERPYAVLGAAARELGLQVYTHPSGLTLMAAQLPSLDGVPTPQLDSIITLFDTPEKFADPNIATRYIPTLAHQGQWTDHVKVTPEQLALLHGPETKWPITPRSEYDLKGFNSQLLGSKVPPPGVYPRVLFSPEDVPEIAARIKSTKMGQMSLNEMQHLFQKSWWDPTSDGQIFPKLVSGDTSGLEWAGRCHLQIRRTALPDQVSCEKHAGQAANNHISEN